MNVTLIPGNKRVSEVLEHHEIYFGTIGYGYGYESTYYEVVLRIYKIVPLKPSFIARWFGATERLRSRGFVLARVKSMPNPPEPSEIEETSHYTIEVAPETGPRDRKRLLEALSDLEKRLGLEVKILGGGKERK